MRNLAASGIGGQLLHEIPILTASFISGRVLKIEVLLDVVGGKFNSSLLI